MTVQDVIDRMGGDEFFVIHASLTKPEAVAARFHQMSRGFAPMQQRELEVVMAAADRNATQNPVLQGYNHAHGRHSICD